MYLTGRFRDAEFNTLSNTTTFGRRTAIYELPFDEKGVAHMDMGRAARRFQINAILLNKSPLVDYTAARDKLIAALEKPGAGQLLHPTLGAVMVVIKGDITITESTEFGGMCEISFQATESRDPLPAGGLGGLVNAVAAAKSAAGNNFVTQLLTEGPNFLIEDVTAVMDSCIDTLRDINTSITAVLAAPFELSSRIDAISRELSQLLQTPRKLFDAIDGFIESLIASAGRVFDAASQEDVPATLAASNIKKNAIALVVGPGVLAADRRMGGALSKIPANLVTPSRNQQRQNRAAIVQSLHASTLANAVGALALTPPTSRTEALEVSRELTTAIVELADGQFEGVEVSAELYEALKTLASALQDYTDVIAGTAPEVRVHKMASSLPVEVLAHKLYANARRADEILERNPHIAHAGMLPPQGELEVLDR